MYHTIIWHKIIFYIIMNAVSHSSWQTMKEKCKKKWTVMESGKKRKHFKKIGEVSWNLPFHFLLPTPSIWMGSIHVLQTFPQTELSSSDLPTPFSQRLKRKRQSDYFLKSRHILFWRDMLSKISRFLALNWPQQWQLPATANVSAPVHHFSVPSVFEGDGKWQRGERSQLHGKQRTWK